MIADDLITEKIDFSFRIGKLKNSRLTAIKLGSSDLVCCASPSYITTNGMPSSFNEILDYHNLIVPSFLNLAEKFSHLFNVKTPELTLVHTMDSETAIHRAVLNGIGVSVFLNVSIKENLVRGELLNVLPKLELPAQDIYLVFHKRDFMPEKMKIFKRFIQDNFRL